MVNYVLYKLLELMRVDELLPQVPIIKTKLRLMQHDTIWKQICEELDWTFKKTIDFIPKIKNKKMT